MAQGVCTAFESGLGAAGAGAAASSPVVLGTGGMVLVMGGMVAGTFATTDELPNNPPPITGRSEGQIVESFPIPGSTTLSLEGIPVIQEESAGIHGLEPTEYFGGNLVTRWTSQDDVWLGNDVNIIGVKRTPKRFGYTEANSTIIGQSAEKVFEALTGRSPVITDPASKAPTDSYIEPGKIEVWFRPASESGGPVIEVFDNGNKTAEKIHFPSGN